MIYILNQDLEVLGVANNRGDALPYYDDLHMETIETGAETYEFSVPGDHPTSEHLQVGNLVVINNLDGDKVMFSIMSIEDTHDDYLQKRIYCEQAGMQLLNEIEVPFKANTAQPIEFYTDRALQWTSWELGENESTATRTLNFEENESVLARLQKLASEFDVELHFTVEMTGSKVTKKKVNLIRQRGNSDGKRFTYTKDIRSIIRKVEAYDVVTAVRGIGRTDDKGVTTTFVDEVYDDGNYYTEAGSYILHSREALERWGRQGGHIFGVFEYDTPNASTLFSRALTHLKKSVEPKVTYEVDVALLERLAEYDEEKVRVGDTVKIQDTGFSPALYLEARVIQLETSYTNPENDKATLGNYKLLSSTINDAIRSLQSKLLQKESTWDQMGEIIIKRPQPPENPIDGQLWVDTSKTPYQTMVWVEADNAWKPTSVDADYVDENIAYKSEMLSTNGYTFRNGQISTTLYVRVYKGKVDVTDTLPVTAFSWKKYDANGQLDTVWTNAHAASGKMVLVSSDDLFQKASFKCDIII
ncbi:phage tail spike protein [Exiguobacterium aurantiacum]|uniref:phage tail spike protein n=1 Tax=Exiguobacterium aurantiacum TaxID=33987 RepID=UPI00384D500D